jgi:methylenetetrahydrofolate reductase (NADPH)
MRVAEVLRGPRPAFSFEFFPPRTEAGIAKLYATIEHLAELRPAFVSVTYGAGGSTQGRTVELVSHIKHGLGVEPVAHLTCVGQSKDEIRTTLYRLSEAGIENVLALRGDPPTGQRAFEGHPDGFGHADELIAFARSENGFCLGAAAYPEGHVENPDREDDLRRILGKVKAGADFLVTQLFFDNAHYFDFVARARAIGIGVPILPGLMPVTDVAQIERFTLMCGASLPADLRARLERVRDDKQAVMAVGIEWAIRQARELLAGGAPGIHFYTLNRSLATRVVCFSLMGGGV